MNAQEKFDARDSILQGAVNMVLMMNEAGEHRKATMIQLEATRLARKWKIEKPGLPDSFDNRK